ncbi:MAG: putative adenylate cyclase [Myxococcales bacterium]|nr:putative adenylate cyclase [Myxococcales bacterium]
MIATTVLLVTTVAVMPFKDLSGGKGQVGEAIRETVTSDLKDVGLKVVERGNIDKVIAEQNLQSKKNDLGMAESIRVGTLLGATMIVAGAYQRAASQVRVTARFVDVATGEVKGSAKVDGSTSDFLTLQDKITAELVRSAGMESGKVQQFSKRVRPKVKSFKAIELYGDAVTQTDEKKKLELLKLSLNEDPSFTYASRDLDALEKRMKQYAAISDQAQRSASAELLRKYREEKDPMQRYNAYLQLSGQLMMQARWRTLIAVSRAVVADPPKPPYPNMPPADQQAQENIIRGYDQLHDDDGILREGEKYLQKYPSSMTISIVQMWMNNAINHKHAVEDGKKTAVEEIAKLPPAERADPCKTGMIYNDKLQLKEAKRDLIACDKKGGPPYWPPGNMSTILARIALDTSDMPLMKMALGRLEKENPTQYRQLQFWGRSISDE